MSALSAADPTPAPETCENTVGMKFVRIQPGTFRMGSESGDNHSSPSEPRIRTVQALLGHRTSKPT